MTGATRPLDRFPLVRTRDVSEMCAALERVYAKPRLEFAAGTRKVDARINYLPMNYIGLGNAGYGIELGFAYPESERVLQSFPMAGRGKATIDGRDIQLDPANGVVASPGMNFAARLDADYQTVLLLIRQRALTEKLAALTGRPIDEALLVEPVQDYTRPAAKALRAHVFSVAEMLNAASATISSLLLAEFEDSLAISFLLANSHNYSHLLRRSAAEAAPWQVRRAEEFIAGNWEQSMTSESFAEATGIGTLDLSRTFRKRRGYSPWRFARRVRLDRAHDLLRHPNVATTVAGVAARCGFADLGRFSCDYMAAFGERPSDTLRRGRGAAPPPEMA